MVFDFYFGNVVYYYDWFSYVEPSLWMENIFHLVAVDDLFYVVGFCLLKFCWEFFHLYSSKILAYNFIIWQCLVWFWYSGDGGFIEYLWDRSFFILLEKFKNDQYKFFFVYLIEFPGKANLSWTNFCREFIFLNYMLNFICGDQSVQIIYFLFIQFRSTLCN